MDEVDRIVEQARDAAKKLVRRAGERMLAGADADRIHANYVIPGLTILGDVEVSAVLAAAGDSDALASIETSSRDLANLLAALEDEG